MDIPRAIKKLQIKINIIDLSTTANTDLAKMAVQCSEDKFMVN